jgi:hypothetical protein
VLDVRATVDDDRTHSALDLKWQSARLLEMKSGPFAGAPAARADPMEVQFPVTELLTADTTLLLPTGGTALVYLGEAKEGPALGAETEAPDAEKAWVKAQRIAAGPLVLLVKASVIKGQLGGGGGK